MASSFFNISEPGLIYLSRGTYRADPAELPADPQNAKCPLAGEWLALSANRLVRPGDVTVSLANLKAAFPFLGDRGRTDVQSSAVAGLATTDGPGAKMSVSLHKGAVATTSMFATMVDGTTALTYGDGVNLVVARFLDSDKNVRVGLAPAGTTITTPATPGTGKEGDLVDISSLVVAKVQRAPYSISGVGMNAGRGFPAQQATAVPVTLRQVLDIQIQ